MFMFFVPPFRSVLGLALSGLSTVWDDGSGPDRGLHQVTFSLWQLTHQSRWGNQLLGFWGYHGYHLPCSQTMFSWAS